MGGGVLVIAFEFGNLCFNSPASEQSIIMVIASPSEFSSLDKFIRAALTFLETDGELYGKRTVLYKERVNLPASNEDITFITEKTNEMNLRVKIVFQPVKKAVNLLPPKWNQVTMCLETEHDYIFYSWVTTV
ncbi:hypothetical protein [Flavonifractor plautii]|uniref:hypothetical protein n=1 Tax=Flavonifractor plautii TaxID=292800 RepID=UPI00232D11C4|nr:hypothetical protein [Flavonifractor plautii]MDB7953730.1 hypothetical protein [Flavonifractor plautii]